MHFLSTHVEAAQPSFPLINSDFTIVQGYNLICIDICRKYEPRFLSVQSEGAFKHILMFHSRYFRS